MDLKDIAAVSGKSGLFLVLKPTRNGVILETIDQAKSKFVANANTRVSLLKEISIYTTSKEGSVPLEDVFAKIHEKFGKSINLNAKTSSDKELYDFIAHVVPDYDSERVYLSDVKKLVSWYNIIGSSLPERFDAPKEEKKDAAPKAKAKDAEDAEVTEEPKTKKATAKKSKEEEPKEEKASKPKAKSASKK
ncbi:MAG: DUF5606 domain-containing protein [Cytophagaceae bacterium]